jgi:hypothetical protein
LTSYAESVVSIQTRKASAIVISNDIDEVEHIARRTIYRFGEGAAHTARERAQISADVRRHALGLEVARHCRRDRVFTPEASMMDESSTGFLSARELLIGLGLASPLLLVLAFIVEMIAG